jgi:hypothetical protein
MGGEQYQPFFVIGCPRSGTTLLQVLIDANSSFAIPPESHIFERFLPVIAGYGNLEQKNNLLKLTSHILKDMPVRKWGLTCTPEELIRQMKSCDVNDVIRSFFEEYCTKVGKSNWGDKTPQHIFFLFQIKELYPDAHFVFLVRDGRDVAESTKRVYIGPKSISAIAQRWKKYITLMNAFTGSVSQEQCILVRYEDLVSDPETTRKRILHFLGEINCREVSCDSLLDQSEVGRVYTKKKSLHSSLKEGVTTNKIGRFKVALSPREVEIFECIAGKELSQFGYERLFATPEPPSFVEKVYFTFLDYSYRYFRKLFTLRGLRIGWIQLRHHFQYYLRKILLRKNMSGE